MVGRSLEKTPPPPSTPNNVAPGNYTVTAHVTDPKEKKNNEASCTRELHRKAASAEESADHVHVREIRPNSRQAAR